MLIIKWHYRAVVQPKIFDYGEETVNCRETKEIAMSLEISHSKYKYKFTVLPKRKKAQKVAAYWLRKGNTKTFCIYNFKGSLDGCETFS